MPPTPPTTCNHQREPDTTMCLRCRHDQIQATQRPRQEMLMRFLGVASVAGIIGVAEFAGGITIRGEGTKVTETSAGNVTLRQEGKAKTRTPHMPRPLTPTPVHEPAVAAVAESHDSAPAVPTPAPAPVT